MFAFKIKWREQCSTRITGERKRIEVSARDGGEMHTFQNSSILEFGPG
jgi:hypothetical protein